jgi:hypothetical protein
MERRKLSRREFLKKIGKVGKVVIGAAAGGAMYELAKESKRKTIENAPEGIYYALTGEKIDLEGIKKKNYQKILSKLREKLEEKIDAKIDLKIFGDFEKGIENLQKADGTVILVLWPAREYPHTVEPSLGILKEIKENYLRVWDPNQGEVEYIEGLKIWKEQKLPIAYLSINKKIQITQERKEEIEESIKESRIRP